MCIAKIKQILFPTNVLGKDRKSIEYTLPEGGDINVLARWQGERLEMVYTYFTRDRNTRKTTQSAKRFIETESNEMDVDIVRGSHSRWIYFVGATNIEAQEYNKVYFSCTNVTQLIVNGEQLI